MAFNPDDYLNSGPALATAPAPPAAPPASAAFDPDAYLGLKTPPSPSAPAVPAAGLTPAPTPAPVAAAPVAPIRQPPVVASVPMPGRPASGPGSDFTLPPSFPAPPADWTPPPYPSTTTEAIKQPFLSASEPIQGQPPLPQMATPIGLSPIPPLFDDRAWSEAPTLKGDEGKVVQGAAVNFMGEGAKGALATGENVSKVVAHVARAVGEPWDALERSIKQTERYRTEQIPKIEQQFTTDKGGDVGSFLQSLGAATGGVGGQGLSFMMAAPGQALTAKGLFALWQYAPKTATALLPFLPRAVRFGLNNILQTIPPEGSTPKQQAAAYAKAGLEGGAVGTLFGAAEVGAAGLAAILPQTRLWQAFAKAVIPSLVAGTVSGKAASEGQRPAQAAAEGLTMGLLTHVEPRFTLKNLLDVAKGKPSYSVTPSEQLALPKSEGTRRPVEEPIDVEARPIKPTEGLRLPEAEPPASPSVPIEPPRSKTPPEMPTAQPVATVSRETLEAKPVKKPVSLPVQPSEVSEAAPEGLTQPEMKSSYAAGQIRAGAIEPEQPTTKGGGPIGEETQGQEGQRHGQGYDAQAVLTPTQPEKPLETSGAVPVTEGAAPVPQPAKPGEVVMPTERGPQTVQTQPSQAQAEEGNYKKAHVRRDGLEISIENPAGSVRRGVGPDGKPWATQLRDDYGYIRGRVGKDKDHLDVFIRPDSAEGGPVFVVNQKDPKTGNFDEHKVMMGYDTPLEARAAYRSNYEKGKAQFLSITPMSQGEFQEWLKSGNKNVPAKLTQEMKANAKQEQGATRVRGDVVNAGGAGEAQGARQEADAGQGGEGVPGGGQEPQVREEGKVASTPAGGVPSPAPPAAQEAEGGGQTRAAAPAKEPWEIAESTIGPYADGLRKLSDKELRAEDRKISDSINKWASDTPSILPDGTLNPKLGNDQAYFDLSAKLSAIGREQEARKRPEPDAALAAAEPQKAAPLVAKSTTVEAAPEISPKKAGAAFRKLVQADRQKAEELVFNWNDGHLSEDGENIVGYPGRDRQFSKGKEGGKIRASKTEFINWLLSDQPLDPKVYSQTKGWIESIRAARASVQEVMSELPKPASGSLSAETEPQPPLPPTGEPQKEPWEMPLDEWRPIDAYRVVEIREAKSGRAPVIDISDNTRRAQQEMETLKGVFITDKKGGQTIAEFDRTWTVADAREALDEIGRRVDGRDWDSHRLSVEQAVREGKNVPEFNIKEYWDYPSIASAKKKKAEAAPGPEAGPLDAKALRRMSPADLTAMATARGIKTGRGDSKGMLIRSILESEQAKAAEPAAVPEAGKDKPTEILARETTGDILYEYRIAPYRNAESPQLKFEIQERANGSSWESALMGKFPNRKDAYSRFIDRHTGDIENVDAVDPILKEKLDQHLAEKRATAVKETQKREQEQKDYQDKVEGRTRFKAAMDSQKLTGKRGDVPAGTMEGKPLTQPGTIYGEFAIRKPESKHGSPAKYSIVHIKSGFRMGPDAPTMESAKERIQAFRISGIDFNKTKAEQFSKSEKAIISETLVALKEGRAPAWWLRENPATPSAKEKIGPSEAPKNVPDMFEGGGTAGGGIGSPVHQLSSLPSLSAPAPSSGASAAAVPRIAIAPIGGSEGKPRSFQDLLKGLGGIVERQIVKARTGRAGGVYYPGSTRTTIRFHGDLDTAAHETAHALDDAYGIVADWKEKRVRSPYDKELKPFWVHGSVTKSGPRARLSYKRGEGVAEWLRAWLLNPDQAEKAAPAFAEFFKTKVPSAIIKDLRSWGDEVRQWAGQPAHERGLSNVRVEEPPRWEKLKEKLIGDQAPGLNTGLWDRVMVELSDDLQPIIKSIGVARKIRGIKPDRPGQRKYFDPSKDPETLIRLVGGTIDKVKTAIEDGVPIFGTTQRATPGFYQYLFEPFDHASKESMKADQKLTISLLLNERILEKARQIQEAANKESEAAAAGISDPIERAKVVGRIQRKAQIATQRLAGTGGGIFGDAQQAVDALKELASLPEDHLGRIRQSADRYRVWADSLLRYMVDAGRLSESAYKAITAQNKDYAAFKRLMDDVALPGGQSGMGKRLGAKGEPIKRFKGSTREIENPYVSLMEQTHAMLKEADRNAALRAFNDLLTSPRGMHEGPAVNLASIGARGKTGDKNSLQVFVDGEPQTWVYSPDVFKALKGWGEVEDFSLMFRLLQIPRKVLQAGVVYEPGFAVRNSMGDAISRGVVSETGSRPWDVIHPISIKDVKLYRLAGGGNMGYYMHDRVSYHRELSSRLKELSDDSATIMSMPGKALEQYERFMGGSELMGRMAEFRAARDKAIKEFGYSDYEAALYAANQARGLMDFQVAGSFIRRLNKYVPFVNAAVRGLERMVRSASKDPWGFLLRWSMYVLVPRMITYLWNTWDDKDAEAYRQLPAWRRDMFLNFRIGNHWLTLPNGFELGVFGAGVERAIEYVRGDQRAFEGFAGSAAKRALPIDEGTMMGPFKGIIETMVNYNIYMDRPIVPVWEEGLDLDRRKRADSASRIGKLIQEAVGVDGRKIDHLIQSQLGGLGRLLTKASDIERSDKAASIAEFGLSLPGVVKTPIVSSSRDVQKVYDLAEKMNLRGDADVKSLSSMLKDYREMDADDPGRRDAEQEIYDFASELREELEEKRAEDAKELDEE